MSGVGVVVLAAGLGTRMRSRLPKVLHPVCGAPMAWHVIEAARALAPARIVVVTGHEAERVEAALAADDVRFVRQEVLDGTADFGLVSFPRPSRKWAVIPWREELMVVACSPSHRLAGFKTDPRNVGFRPVRQKRQGNPALEIARQEDLFTRPIHPDRRPSHQHGRTCERAHGRLGGVFRAKRIRLGRQHPEIKVLRIHRRILRRREASRQPRYGCWASAPSSAW